MIYSIEIVKGNDGKNHKLVHPVANRQQLLSLRDSEQNRLLLQQCKAGDKKAKFQLLQLVYNLGYARDGQLLTECKSMGSYFFHDVDCYDEEQTALYMKQILEKKDAIGLMMLERSASGGWHLVCRRERGKTILECQVRVASVLEIEMDTSAHDLPRVVFSTDGSADNLVYLDDALFGEPMTADECEQEYVVTKERETQGEEVIPAEAKRADKHYRPWTTARMYKTDNSEVERSEESGKTYPTDYHGIAFSDIIRKYWELNNNGFEPTEGDRDTLTFQLASDLRHICGKNFQWLDQVIPCYDGFPVEEKRQKIRNALTSKYEGFPQRLRDTLNAVERKQTAAAGNEEQVQVYGNDSLPPLMPKRLPKLIQLLTSKTPAVYKAAVAHAVFPPLATHLCKVRFNYTDNIEHEATLMTCLMAESGSGKSCVDQPIKHIMEDIRQRDKENLKREAEWKKDCQHKGANKDKLLRPEGLVIQEIDPDMTKPALVTRMDESEGHFVYVKLNEIDLFEQLKGQTGKQHFQLMCLAFDTDAQYGQTRVGTQSVTARPMCRFNWNASTTIIKGRQFFKKVLTDGPISRLNFCTIPEEEEIGGEQPVFGKYDAAFDEALRPYVQNLTAARGLIDIPQAFKLAKVLQQECAEFARLSQSKVYWDLSHRACVIAWLKACVLYVANGQKWERSIEDFTRWSLNYDMWCKMRFFGEDIERANHMGERVGLRGPRNLLELLPDDFNLDDAKRVRRQQGMTCDSSHTIKMIRTWVNRGYVIQNTEYSFEKRKFRDN